MTTMPRWIRPVFVVCAIVSAVVFVRSWLDPFDDAPFASATWKQVKSKVLRAPMSRDLINNHLPQGMSKAEVLELLGPPIKEIRNPGENVFNGSKKYAKYASMMYGIGSFSEYGYDDAFVYVYLDKSDEVIGAAISGY